MKEITVCGLTFQEGKAVTVKDMNKTNRYNNIFEAYNQPSIAKLNIWESWHYKFRHSTAYIANLWIMSKNTFMFTIGCYVETPEGAYFLEIYPTRQVAHRIVD